MRILAMLGTSYAVAPALLPFEITSVLTQDDQQARLPRADRDAYLEILRRLPIQIEQRPMFWICQQLLAITSRNPRLSAYDAAYLELAAREGLPLATLDEELRRAAVAAGIPLAEV